MQEKKDDRLGTEPLGKLMVSLALPAVAAQLINLLYNIVDRIYIGHIKGYGDVALTGVGVTFPIIMLIAAFSAFAGMGGAPLASIQLGKKDYQEAEKILGNSAGMIVFFSVVLTIGFLIFKTPVLYAFGASDATIGYAEDYITIYLFGTIFVQLALGLNTFISGQGAAKTAMLSVLIGAVINICLDPVFIFALDMGVKGAAFATVISQAVSAVWVVRFLVSGKSVIRLKTSNMRLEGKIVRNIASLGISPFIMQSTESLVSITLNAGLQKYGGDLYVGTMSIMTSVMQMIVIPVQGITQGVQPIISYNYGAGNYDRVKNTYKKAVTAAIGISVVAFLLFQLAPRQIIGIFGSGSEEYFLFAEKFFRIYMFFTFINGIQPITANTFTSIGKAGKGVFLSLTRQIIFLLPLLIILPVFIGIEGVMFSAPVADGIAAVLCIYFIRKEFKHMGARA